MIAQLTPPVSGDLVAEIETNLGTVKVKLFPEKAPKSVENFTTHAKNGYYDGVIFHRVIKDFMIQGGDPTGTGRGGESIWGAPFEDEFNLDLRHFYGALSMANAGPGTNGSQFFIIHANECGENLISQMRNLVDGGFPTEITDEYERVGGCPSLDFRHSVFGQVYEGMDVVDVIAKTATNPADKPLEDVVITGIKVETI